MRPDSQPRPALQAKPSQTDATAHVSVERGTSGREWVGEEQVGEWAGGRWLGSRFESERHMHAHEMWSV